MTGTHRYLSLGAGVQSSAVLLLAARGEIAPFDAAVFADTGWEPASPTRLSTGEAIGVGAALMMVILTEWERDGNLLRGKRDGGSLRFLFLDEANRLSQDNLGVLFDLCQNLDLQLLIAAPEVAKAEGNTTYRLIRRVSLPPLLVQLLDRHRPIADPRRDVGRTLGRRGAGDESANDGDEECSFHKDDHAGQLPTANFQLPRLRFVHLDVGNW